MQFIAGAALRRLLVIALSAAAVAATSSAASAAGAQYPQIPPALASAAMAYPTDPCDPAGTTSADAALASELNSRLRADMRGYMDAYRTSCARIVIETAKAQGLHPRAATIAIATVIVESHLQNINIQVDHTSLGLFQQQDNWGSRSQRLDPVWATKAFLNKMLRLYPNNSWMSAPIGEVCQAVQVSAYGYKYQPQAADAQIIVDALWAGESDIPTDDGGSAQARADVNGDGFADLVMLYDYGDATSKLWVSLSNGESMAAQTTWWDFGAGNWDASRSRLAVADYNKDGRADVGILYDYGGKNTKFWVLMSTGTKFAAPDSWWAPAAGQWDASRSRLAVGDYNEDGNADVGILYDYGNKTSKFWVLISNGSGLAAPDSWWAPAAGQWDASRSRLAVGDYNEDGTADLGILYDYGASTSKFWVLLSTGTGFAALTSWWAPAAGQWDATHSKLAVGDYDKDGSADVGILYDYGANTTKFWVLISTGSGFAAADSWRDFNAGQWDAASTKLN